VSREHPGEGSQPEGNDCDGGEPEVQVDCESLTRRQATNRGTNHAAEAEDPVEAGQNRSANAALDFHGMGIHGHVLGPAADADEGKANDQHR
jgi:hypothetical protein